MSKDSLESNADARTTARRRLVRGVFAAPAALTLYSGGAIAATSVSCVVKQQRTDFFVGQAPDKIGASVRVPVYVLGKASNGTDSRTYWVKGSDFDGLVSQRATEPRVYIANSSTVWQLIGAAGGANLKFQGTPVALGEVISFTPQDSGNGPALLDPATDVAVRINGQGQIVGVEQYPAMGAYYKDPAFEGSAMSTSCWSSFRAVAAR